MCVIFYLQSPELERDDQSDNNILLEQTEKGNYIYYGE